MATKLKRVNFYVRPELNELIDSIPKGKQAQVMNEALAAYFGKATVETRLSNLEQDFQRFKDSFNP